PPTCPPSPDQRAFRAAALATQHQELAAKPAAEEGPEAVLRGRDRPSSVRCNQLGRKHRTRKYLASSSRSGTANARPLRWQWDVGCAPRDPKQGSQLVPSTRSN